MVNIFVLFFQGGANFWVMHVNRNFANITVITVVECNTNKWVVIVFTKQHRRQQYFWHQYLDHVKFHSIFCHQQL